MPAGAVGGGGGESSLAAPARSPPAVGDGYADNIRANSGDTGRHGIVFKRTT